SITIDNSGAVKTVTLNRIKADTSVSVPTVHLDTATQNVTFTATVSPEAFAGGSPGGTVTFKDKGGTFTIGDGVPVGGGVFRLTVPLASLPLSPHDVTATYSGDNDFNSSGPSAAVIFGDLRVTAVSPTNLVLSPVTLNTADITFNHAVETASISAPGAVQLFAPDGTSIPFTLNTVSPTEFILNFAAQSAAGVYALKVS